MWEHTGTGEVGRWAHIDGALEFKKGPPKYSYLVKVTLSREAIKSLRIETDLMTSPHALARLSVGGNKVQYTDDTAEPHEVTVTHVWRESDSVEPPEPPAEPISPDHGETVRATTVPFRWTPVRHAKWYHIRVSRCEDMKLAYRPSFDAIIESAEHHCPFAGMFNPDEQYYWQVRVCNAQGVWGRWSTVWKFKWQGPRIPTGLSPASKLGGRIDTKSRLSVASATFSIATPGPTRPSGRRKDTSSNWRINRPGSAWTRTPASLPERRARATGGLLVSL